MALFSPRWYADSLKFRGNDRGNDSLATVPRVERRDSYHYGWTSYSPKYCGIPGDEVKVRVCSL